MSHGEFSERASRRKEWEVNRDLYGAMLEVIPPKSTVNDFGAGGGAYVKALIQGGYDAFGYDGTSNIEQISDGYVSQVDLTNFEIVTEGDVRVAQWTISIEVGEHIPLVREKRFIDNLCASAIDGLFVSWAVPGQRGRNHINCHLPEYVAIECAHRGWKLDEDATTRARLVAGKGFHKKLLVFRQ